MAPRGPPRPPQLRGAAAGAGAGRAGRRLCGAAGGAAADVAAGGGAAAATSVTRLEGQTDGLGWCWAMRKLSRKELREFERILKKYPGDYIVQ